MAPYFSKENLDKLHAGRTEMHQRFGALRETFVVRVYRSDRGREFACHGFARRLGIMVRAVDTVFEKLPPELECIPAKKTVDDAIIAIQSFVMNAFGCLENLAWMWVCERPVWNDGKQLDPMKVGLGPKCKEVRASFTQEFITHLENRQDWVDKHLKGFRDSLAHRIPLYIPPYIVPPEKVEEYNKLEVQSGQALRQLDVVAYEKLQSAQKALGLWRPWMTHSATEKSPGAVFHIQLLADYMTIDEFGRAMLEEMARQGV
ncbi:hypothetical protein GHK58_20335 [Sinorhizobium meliloti]|uniref:hypothetical protein n=1 Tax=Rhizobium meliloti TaxID=382 RepID=UPI00129774AB|nr:hypothetical protein [Sinorhizobium meliloti]MQX42498.1 hypothetical protein [Sinorhizobium meliloti]